MWVKRDLRSVDFPCPQIRWTSYLLSPGWCGTRCRSCESHCQTQSFFVAVFLPFFKILKTACKCFRRHHSPSWPNSMPTEGTITRRPTESTIIRHYRLYLHLHCLSLPLEYELCGDQSSLWLASCLVPSRALEVLLSEGQRKNRAHAWTWRQLDGLQHWSQPMAMRWPCLQSQPRGLRRKGGRDGMSTFLLPFPEVQHGFGWRPRDSGLRGGEGDSLGAGTRPGQGVGPEG